MILTNGDILTKEHVDNLEKAVAHYEEKHSGASSKTFCGADIATIKAGIKLLRLELHATENRHK